MIPATLECPLQRFRIEADGNYNDTNILKILKRLFGHCIAGGGIATNTVDHAQRQLLSPFEKLPFANGALANGAF